MNWKGFSVQDLFELKCAFFFKVHSIFIEVKNEHKPSNTSVQDMISSVLLDETGLELWQQF